jgi:hypothetical protein
MDMCISKLLEIALGIVYEQSAVGSVFLGIF